MAYLAPPAVADITAALFDHDGEARERAMVALLDAETSGASPALLQMARNIHAADDLQIDDDAGTSPTDGGTWVQAWVFVETDAADDEGEGAKD